MRIVKEMQMKLGEVNIAALHEPARDIKFDLRSRDEKVALSMGQEAIQRFADLNSCSFDKGFHRPTNRVQLGGMLDKVVLPKKGKLSLQDKERENSEGIYSGTVWAFSGGVSH